jgi:hypothetical protein
MFLHFNVRNNNNDLLLPDKFEIKLKNGRGGSVLKKVQLHFKFGWTEQCKMFYRY